MRIALILLLLFTPFTSTVQAEESTWDTSGYIGLIGDYVARDLGVVVGKGIHAQGGIDLTHESGFFVGGWASSDGYAADGWSTNDGDGFKFEVDASIGLKQTAFKDSLHYQVDFAYFWIDTGNGTLKVPNFRLILNSNREGLAPYAKIMYFLDDDGPGRGLSHRLGVKYNQFALEFGGHNGLFGSDAKFVTFGRLNYTTKPIDRLGGATASVWAQVALEDDDLIGNEVTFLLNWTF